MTALAIVFALLAALLFAVASVAQQKAASGVADEDAKGIHLILTLIHRPLWWAGFVGDSGGYLCQAVALGFGSLLIVQPLLITALLFALPLGAAWAGRRLSRSDWVWALVLTAALTVFLFAGNPTKGVDQAPFRAWAVVGTVLLGILIVCLIGSRTRHGSTRALLLAVATGILYGVAAAMTKSVVDIIGEGITPIVTSWETYVLIATATLGTILQQSSFQAGSLEASLPAVTVLEPVVAALLGMTALQERVQADGLEWILIGLSVVAMVAGTLKLAHSSAKVEPAPTGRR